MTREQYEAFDNAQYLPETEKDRARAYNAKNNYALSQGKMKRFATQHKKARSEENYGAMAYIEYLLTDINFHSFCGSLCSGDYKSAQAEITDIFVTRPNEAIKSLRNQYFQGAESFEIWGRRYGDIREALTHVFGDSEGAKALLEEWRSESKVYASKLREANSGFLAQFGIV